VGRSRNVDAAVSSARARLAAKKRYHPNQDHADDKRDLVTANIAAYLKETLAAAPDLTVEQRSQLAELLKPARDAVTQARLAELGADDGAA
jgi:hypothetical protein